MNLNKSFIIIFLIVGLFSIASVCASDVNDTVNRDYMTDDVFCDFVLADESMIVHHDETSVSEHDDNGSVDWYNLDSDIQNLQSGDVYDIKHDYIKPDNASVIGINIKADNVIINGNGHVIYGNINNTIKEGEFIDGVGNIFTVSGNNVKIINLTISNAGYEAPINSFNLTSNYVRWSDIDSLEKFFYIDSLKKSVYLKNSYKIFLNSVNFSPICWVGNNGICSDCVFRNNKAFAGGSITWLGNDGFLNNTKFINSSATRVGGAIYYINDNFKYNITYCNVSSGWIEKNVIYNPQGFVSPFYSDIVCNIFGSQMDFTRCLFDTLFYGGIQNYNGTLCYAQTNDGDFAITFAKEIVDVYRFTTLTQTFYFKNVVNNSTDYYHNADNILHALASLDFNIDFKRTGFYKVDSEFYYNGAVGYNAEVAFKNIPNYSLVYSAVLPRNMVKNYDVLRVDIFNDVKSHSTWKPQNMGYDIVYIDGHNFTIDGASGERNEYKFASLSGEKCIFLVNNLVLCDFNNAMVNDGGYCICENVTFKANKMDYWIDQDFGAGILNSGVTICNNCSFIDNYCSRGGAIFNQGALILNNCTFDGNKAYRVGNNVLNVDKGQVFLDGEQINGSSGVIKYEKSISSTLAKVLKWGSIAISAVVGVVVGIYFGPVAGVIAGAATGLVLGTIVSVVTNRYTYDMHYNPLKNTIFIIGTNVAAGIVGGLIGGYVGRCLSAGTQVIEEVAESESEYSVITESEDAWGEVVRYVVPKYS